MRLTVAVLTPARKEELHRRGPPPRVVHRRVECDRGRRGDRRRDRHGQRLTRGIRRRQLYRGYLCRRSTVEVAQGWPARERRGTRGGRAEGALPGGGDIL